MEIHACLFCPLLNTSFTQFVEKLGLIQLQVYYSHPYIRMYVGVRNTWFIYTSEKILKVNQVIFCVQTLTITMHIGGNQQYIWYPVLIIEWDKISHDDIRSSSSRRST